MPKIKLKPCPYCGGEAEICKDNYLGHFDSPQQANNERKKIVKILDWVVENLKNKNTVGGDSS